MSRARVWAGSLVAAGLLLSACGGGEETGTSGERLVPFEEAEQDGEAQSAAKTAQVALEQYRGGGDADGYEGAGPADLLQFADPESPDYEEAERLLTDEFLSIDGASDRFSVTATSTTGNTFTVARGPDGTVTYSCTEAGRVLCPEDGNWNDTVDFEVTDIPEELAGPAELARQDAEIKASLRTAQTAMETYAVDHDGAYTGAGLEELAEIEATLSGEPIAVRAKPNGYRLAAKSDSGTVFSITRKETGEVLLACNDPGVAGCNPDGGW